MSDNTEDMFGRSTNVANLSRYPFQRFEMGTLANSKKRAQVKHVISVVSHPEASKASHSLWRVQHLARSYFGRRLTRPGKDLEPAQEPQTQILDRAQNMELAL